MVLFMILMVGVALVCSGLLADIVSDVRFFFRIFTGGR